MQADTRHHTTAEEGSLVRRCGPLHGACLATHERASARVSAPEEAVVSRWEAMCRNGSWLEAGELRIKQRRLTLRSRSTLMCAVLVHW